jgi:hypothetical protein
MPKFTLETWCVLVVKLDEYTVDRVVCKSFAAASVAACDALKAGALSVEIIPQ